VMTTFLLLPGAGGEADYWGPVSELLQRAGHTAIAVDLPADDPEAGLSAYADLTVAAAEGHTDVVLVAQSMGGVTAPLVSARIPLRALVLVNAMIPLPGESAGAWGEAVGSEPARVAAAEAGGHSVDFDLVETFLHDVPAEVLDPAAMANGRDEAEIAFTEPCEFDTWPDVPITVLVGRDDRLFPADFQVRVARERLGVDADVLPGGHLMALANPQGVADRLLAVASR
jgi:pimeloyl-ACP methyl ester carboxylesterase